MGIKLLTSLLEACSLISRKISGILIFRKESTILVRAGDNTIAAADADIVIYVDNPIRTLFSSFSGADINTRRFFTLITSDGYCRQLLSQNISLPGNQSRPGYTDG
jgi:hypothetical protein